VRRSFLCAATCKQRGLVRSTLKAKTHLDARCAIVMRCPSLYQRYVHEFENGWLASSELHICVFHVCFTGHVLGPNCQHSHGHQQHQHGAGAGSPYGGRPTTSDVATAKGASMDR
jgi:hypothetical protein